MASATWSGYGKAWGEWLPLVGDRQVATSETARLEVTVDYILQLRDLGVSAALVQRRLSGLAFHFKLRNWVDVTKSFVIRQALKGWRKEHVHTDRRRPVSYSLLGQLVEATVTVCKSSYKACLFQTAFCLAFFAALRVGELVPLSRVRPGGLLADDVLLQIGPAEMLMPVWLVLYGLVVVWWYDIVCLRVITAHSCRSMGFTLMSKALKYF